MPQLLSARILLAGKDGAKHMKTLGRIGKEENYLQKNGTNLQVSRTRHPTVICLTEHAVVLLRFPRSDLWRTRMRSTSVNQNSGWFCGRTHATICIGTHHIFPRTLFAII